MIAAENAISRAVATAPPQRAELDESRKTAVTSSATGSMRAVGLVRSFGSPKSESAF